MGGGKSDSGSISRVLSRDIGVSADSVNAVISSDNASLEPSVDRTALSPSSDQQV